MKHNIDHPRVRADWTCPVCLGPKPNELVVCWACYREQGVSDGNPDVEDKIDEREAFLRTQETVRDVMAKFDGLVAQLKGSMP